MNLFSTLLYFALLALAAAGIFIFGRKYVFSKIKINKFIPLGISVVLLIIQMFVPMTTVVSFVTTLVILYFFLWFIDVQTTGGPKAKEKEIKIVPKAKPNRVKHLNKDNK